MNKYKFSVISLSVGLAFFAGGWLTPAFVFADHTNEHTIQQLLQQVQVLQQQILQLQQATQRPVLQQVPIGVTPSAQTSAFAYNLYLGLSDSETNSEVSALQRFLAGQSGVYPEGLVTGFFGPLTEQAVQRFQKQRGLVSSGSPDTTGYGVVGPRTRALIQESSGAATTQLPASTDVSETPRAVFQTPSTATQVVNDIQLSVSPTSGTAPLTVTLTVDANQFITTHAQIQKGDYSVFFAVDCNADGTFEQQRGPVTNEVIERFSCRYSSAGTYSPFAKVTFEPSEGPESVVYSSLDVVVSQATTLPPPPPPVTGSVDLSASPSSGTAPLNTTLTADAVVFATPLLASIPSSSAWAMQWNFDCNGDGRVDKSYRNQAKLQTHVCSYSSAGTYTASVDVMFDSESLVERTSAMKQVVVSATTPIPSITVLSPNGGENYVSGQGSITINYVSSGIAGKQITAYLYSPTRGNVRFTPAVAENSGSIIMNLELAGGDPVGQYKITLCAESVDSPTLLGKPLCDSSDNYFTLTALTQPSVTLSASLSSITAGQSSTLTWSSRNSTSCTSSWTSGREFTSGSLIVRPEQTTTYTIYCNNDTGQSSPTVSVTVVVVPVTVQPSITVLSPNGGERWEVGKAYQIRWTSVNLGSLLVNISLIGESGKSTLIASNVSNSGLYSWTILNNQLFVGTFVIQVDTGEKLDVKDQSDRYFNIVAPTAATPTISSIVPGQGSANTSVTIYGTNLLGTSDVEFYTSSGQLAGSLTPSFVSAINVIFTINGIFAANVSPGTYQVGVVTNVCTGGCNSNRVGFTLQTPITQQPTISSISPTQGSANTVVTIYGTNLLGASNVEFYTSSGQLAGSLTPSFVSATNVIFTINGIFAANVSPGTYQVGVVTNVCPGGCNSNRVGFTLQTPTTQMPIIQVLSPNGGEQWEAGKPRTVSWTWQNLNEGVDVVHINLLKFSNGQYFTFRTLHSGLAYIGLANVSSIEYAFPDIPADSYLIEATAFRDGRIIASDRSDAAFSIVVPTTTTQLPDYVITRLEVGQQLPTVGDLIPLKFVFKNVGGPGPLPETALVHEGGFSQSPNFSCSGVQILNTGQECEFNLVLSYSTAGTKIISARVDPSNVIQEVDDVYNNVKVIELGVVTPTQPGPGVTLSANPSSITAGQSSVLTWSSANSTSCTSSWTSGRELTSGSRIVYPVQITTYTIYCNNDAGQSSPTAIVTVDVVSVPPEGGLEASGAPLGTNNSIATMLGAVRSMLRQIETALRGL